MCSFSVKREAEQPFVTCNEVVYPPTKWVESSQQLQKSIFIINNISNSTITNKTCII